MWGLVHIFTCSDGSNSVRMVLDPPCHWQYLVWKETVFSPQWIWSWWDMGYLWSPTKSSPTNCPISPQTVQRKCLPIFTFSVQVVCVPELRRPEPSAWQIVISISLFLIGHEILTVKSHDVVLCSVPESTIALSVEESHILFLVCLQTSTWRMVSLLCSRVLASDWKGLDWWFMFASLYHCNLKWSGVVISK